MIMTEKLSSYKYCLVPKCLNTNRSTPEKYFFPVPRHKKMRKSWCNAMKRVDKEPLSFKTSLHCCQDHFDVEKDVENYVKYKLVGGRMILRPGVLPHKFNCQLQDESNDNTKDIIKHNPSFNNYINYKFVDQQMMFKSCEFNVKSLDFIAHNHSFVDDKYELVDEQMIPKSGGLTHESDRQLQNDKTLDIIRHNSSLCKQKQIDPLELVACDLKVDESDETTNRNEFNDMNDDFNDINKSDSNLKGVKKIRKIIIKK